MNAWGEPAGAVVGNQWVRDRVKRPNPDDRKHKNQTTE